MRSLVLLLVVLGGGVACDDEPETVVMPTTPTVVTPPVPAPRPLDVVQFRAIGDLPIVTVRTHTPADGTQQVRTALPYLATVTSSADPIFLSMDAIGVGAGFLQIQILVNGTVIREAYANGFPNPRLSLSVIYRRGVGVVDVPDSALTGG